MARLGLYPALIIVVFGVVAPFFVFKLGRVIGFAPLLALAFVLGLGYGAVKAEYPWLRTDSSETSLRSSAFISTPPSAWRALSTIAVSRRTSRASATRSGLLTVSTFRRLASRLRRRARAPRAAPFQAPSAHPARRRRRPLGRRQKDVGLGLPFAT